MKCKVPTGMAFATRTVSGVAALFLIRSMVIAGDIGLSRKSLEDFRQGDTIRYTTDGSPPDRTSPFVVYGSNSVHVSRTTTFKARLYRPGHLPTDPQTHTVFVAGTDFYYAYGNSWNMVSLPVTRADRRRTSIFPTSVSYAYGFSEGSGYIRQDTLQYGRGYLLKFNEEQTVHVPGLLRTTDTVAVQAGWNLIGTISRPVPDSAVREIPDGIVTSYYYGYTRGYTVARTLWPAMGYWVKASAPGVLILSQENPGLAKGVLTRSMDIDDVLRLSVSGSDGTQQMLYLSDGAKETKEDDLFELPPIPPVGMFDARFQTNRMVERIQEGTRRVIPIVVSSAKYPLTIAWEKHGQFVDATLVVGAEESPMNQQGSTTVSGPGESIALKLNGVTTFAKNFRLENNYPNPFNPVTTIRYYLPEQSFVLLKVYDLLGREVETLVNAREAAGDRSIRWNAFGKASGVYLCRLQVGGFSSVRKLLLIK